MRLLAALIVITACASVVGDAGAEDRDLTIAVSQRQRTYVVHLPPRRSERGPLPVVLAFHGGGGNATGFKDYTGLDAVADREGFVVIYPDGSGRMGRRLLTWNAGDCCGYARDNKVDDVGFGVALLRELARGVPLDPTRVCATGHSNGAMMAYWLAVDAPERIAAIAPVAGMMVTDRFPPARPVPVLHIHSVADPRALYAGGLGPPFPFTNAHITHRAVEPELARWIAHNDCPRSARSAERRTTPSRGSGPDHTATRLVWAPCAAGAEVQLWKLTGAGHGWPGSWLFLSRFRRDGAPPLR